MRPLGVSSRAQPVLWLLAGLVASVLLTVGAVWIFDPRYLYNDDMIIAAVLSGDYTGTPEPRTIYSGALLSNLSVYLYTVWQGLPWFLFFLTFCNVALFVLVGVYFFQRIRNLGPSYLPVALPIILCQALIALWGLLTPSYTSSAIAAAVASVVILFVFNRSIKNRTWIAPILASTALFALALTIRSGGFSLAVLYLSSFPVLILIAKRWWGRPFFLLVFIWAAVVLVERISYAQLYSAARWAEALEVAKDLNLIWSGYVYGSISPIALAQGWSPWEVDLALRLAPLPSPNFSVSSLNEFIDAANPFIFFDWAIRPPSSTALFDALNSTAPGLIMVAVATFCCATYLVWGRLFGLLPWALVVIGGFWASIVIISLGVIRNHPSHVAYPLGAGAGLLLVVGFTQVMASYKRNTCNHFLSFLLTAILMGITLIAVPDRYSYSGITGQHRAKQELWEPVRDRFEDLDPACAVLGVNLGAELAPTISRTSLYGDFPLFQIGWNFLSPLTEGRLRATGFVSWKDLFRPGSCTFLVGDTGLANSATEAVRSLGSTGEFVRVDVEVEGAPEVWQWQGG